MIMIYKKTTYIIHLLLLLAGVTTLAQQDPQYTQYMYNMSVLNPGYATDDSETINLGLLYRAQWVGSVGGPTTASFFAHSSITNRVEGGISIVHDEIGGVVKETKAFADIAYVLPVGETHRLSLGIKAGATFFSTNFNGFVYSDPLPDPAFASNLSKTFPNIGAGAFYFGNQFYLGFSAPNLLRTKHLEKESGVVMNGVEEIHMFMTGGYVFQANSNLKLKPAFMSKMVSGAPLSLDLTLNALLNDNFELGVGYRFDDSVSALVNIRVAPPIRIGYSYDYTLSNLGKFNSGSHEIMILFDINTSEKGYDKSPRFF
ncbi:type IX secretion system membrane protein, PorP/SprF family [Aequorivita viscosa]|uniref:Type IX secretion system membrane protein, PorP/SprF family n=2 Tax=Aequorivita viscosa TaxID=797419 RepID=A0A1M6MCH0_9FLAO|nr:type IX secretion system membrane protein, PorP/SprF family [Aequorivita viscosa]SHJ81174.1 type IX secretion system membrane protein, PorP/SprF family [Aequorivita viscosa]